MSKYFHDLQLGTILIVLALSKSKFPLLTVLLSRTEDDFHMNDFASVLKKLKICQNCNFFDNLERDSGGMGQALFWVFKWVYNTVYGDLLKFLLSSQVVCSQK